MNILATATAVSLAAYSICRPHAWTLGVLLATGIFVYAGRNLPWLGSD